MAEHAYRLTYFNGRGRAEVARYLFALGGVPYEDRRIELQDWPQFKLTTPLGQLPLLEVDGQVFCQSGAIYRFLARQFGFYGRDSVEDLQIDQILGIIGDIHPETSKITFHLKGEEREKAIDNLRDVLVPKFIKFVENEIRGKEWLVGESVTLADVAVYDHLTSAITRVTGAGWRDLSADVTALIERFAALPAIAQHIASRPQTSI